MTSIRTALRLVVVDDDPAQLELAGAMLGESFEVITVQSGAEALRALDGGPTHAIVSDGEMLGMHGVALLERVRTDFPGCGRVLWSGHAEWLDARSVNSSAAPHRLVSKACSQQELVSAVQDAARRARLELALEDRRKS